MKVLHPARPLSRPVPWNVYMKVGSEYPIVICDFGDYILKLTSREEVGDENWPAGTYFRWRTINLCRNLSKSWGNTCWWNYKNLSICCMLFSDGGLE